LAALNSVTGEPLIGATSTTSSPTTCFLPFAALKPMTPEEFEKLAGKAIRGLPKFFRDKMKNVVVIVADAPGRARERRFGGGLLGLYEGIPLLDRDTGYSGAMPDKITLFKKNIEAECSTPEEIEEEVRHVVMHELAHHFGMTDEELRQKGLY